MIKCVIDDILLGIAIGDAYGAGVEFQDRNWIREHVDFSKFINRRVYISVSKDKIGVFTKKYREWDYTDDTEMTIGVIKALISGETFSEELLLKKWIKEYEKGKREKGYGRNGHGSMRWYFSGEKSIDEIRFFQKNRNNPGNAPAMRSVPLGLIQENLINEYSRINACATHPHQNAIISSQCIARAAEFIIIKKGNPSDIFKYCSKTVVLNEEYIEYFKKIDTLPSYNSLEEKDFSELCGSQPIEEPYFLPGIFGVPSDSKYTTGSVLYVIKHATDAYDALKKSILLGGDVDSIASIATGIMAGRFGIESIPVYMKKSVEGVTYLQCIADDVARRL